MRRHWTLGPLLARLAGAAWTARQMQLDGKFRPPKPPCQGPPPRAAPCRHAHAARTARYRAVGSRVSRSGAQPRRFRRHRLAPGDRQARIRPRPRGPTLPPRGRSHRPKRPLQPRIRRFGPRLPGQTQRPGRRGHSGQSRGPRRLWPGAIAELRRPTRRNRPLEQEVGPGEPDDLMAGPPVGRGTTQIRIAHIAASLRSASPGRPCLR